MIDFISQGFGLIMGYFQLIGLIVVILTYIFRSKHLEVKWDKVSNFVSIMVVVAFIKLCLGSGQTMPQVPISNMRNFLFVFLEDAFFVMIPYYACKFIPSKFIKFSLWVLFSVTFGLGHLYQGALAVVITSIYPYFISNHYAKKTSFGTVMVCHFIYDCFVFLIPKINNIISIF